MDIVTLDQFPEEILEHVLDYLISGNEPVSVGTLALVCKRFYLICTADRIWSKVYDQLVSTYRLQHIKTLAGRFPVDHTMRERCIRILSARVLDQCSLCFAADPNRYIHSWGMRICHKCACTQLLSKTAVKQEFGLSHRTLTLHYSDDLAASSSSHGIFFLRTQVAQAAIHYHGSKEAMDKKRKQRALRSSKRASSRLKKEVSRLAAVVEACGARNIDFCQWYEASTATAIGSAISIYHQQQQDHRQQPNESRKGRPAGDAQHVPDQLGPLQLRRAFSKKSSVPTLLERAEWQCESYITKGTSQTLVMSTQWNNAVQPFQQTPRHPLASAAPATPQLNPAAARSVASANVTSVPNELTALDSLTPELPQPETPLPLAADNGDQGHLVATIATAVLRGVEVIYRSHLLQSLWEKSPSLPRWWLRKHGGVVPVANRFYPAIAEFLDAIDVSVASVFDSQATLNKCKALIAQIEQAEKTRVAALEGVLHSVNSACTQHNLSFTEVAESSSFALVVEAAVLPTPAVAASIVTLPFTYPGMSKASLVQQRMAQLHEYCLQANIDPLSPLELAFYRRWTRPRSGITSVFCEFLEGKSPISYADGQHWRDYAKSVERQRLLAVLNGCRDVGLNLISALEKDTVGVAKMYISRYLSFRFVDNNKAFCPFQPSPSSPSSNQPTSTNQSPNTSETALDNDGQADDDDDNQRDEQQQQEVDGTSSDEENPRKRSKRHPNAANSEPVLAVEYSHQTSGGERVSGSTASQEELSHPSARIYCQARSAGQSCECERHTIDTLISALVSWHTFASAVEQQHQQLFSALNCFQSKHLFVKETAMHFQDLPQADFVNLTSIYSMKFKGYFNVNLSVLHYGCAATTTTSSSKYEGACGSIARFMEALLACEAEFSRRVDLVQVKLAAVGIAFPNRVYSIDPATRGILASKYLLRLARYLHVHGDEPPSVLDDLVSEWGESYRARKRREKEARTILRRNNASSTASALKETVSLYVRDGNAEQLHAIATQSQKLGADQAARRELRNRRKAVSEALHAHKKWNYLDPVQQRFCLNSSPTYAKFCADDALTALTTLTALKPSSTATTAQTEHDLLEQDLMTGPSTFLMDLGGDGDAAEEHSPDLFLKRSHPSLIMTPSAPSHRGTPTHPATPPHVKTRRLRRCAKKPCRATILKGPASPSGMPTTSSSSSSATAAQRCPCTMAAPLSSPSHLFVRRIISEVDAAIDQLETVDSGTVRFFAQPRYPPTAYQGATTAHNQHMREVIHATLQNTGDSQRRSGSQRRMTPTF